MHLLSVPPCKAKELQFGVDTDEGSLTFALCSHHASSKCFTCMYINCVVLHFMSCCFWFLLFSSCPILVMFSVVFCKHQNDCKPLDLRATDVRLWAELCPRTVRLLRLLNLSCALKFTRPRDIYMYEKNRQNAFPCSRMSPQCLLKQIKSFCWLKQHEAVQHCASSFTFITADALQ